MVLTTIFEKKTEKDRVQIRTFFEKLSTPVDVRTTHARMTGEIFSPFKIIGWVTVGTGAMLLIASLTQPAGLGQYVNLGAGLMLGLLGGWLYRLHGKFMRREEKEERERTENVDRDVETAIG